MEESKKIYRGILNFDYNVEESFNTDYENLLSRRAY
jgi:hypothetical protein